MILGFRHINTSVSQPGASEFIGLMLQSPISHSLSLSCTDAQIHSFFLASLHLFLSPALPTHLFSWLDWLALFWDQQLGAGEPLWRGIAFNRDEVCLGLLSAPVLSHRVFSVHCNTTLARQGRSPLSGWLYSPLFVLRTLFKKSTMETSVRATELREATLHQPLSWNYIAFYWASILMANSKSRPWSTASDAGVTLGCPRSSLCVTVMGIIMRNGRTYRANTTAVYQYIFMLTVALQAVLLPFFIFFFYPLASFLGIHINLSSFCLILW